MKKLIMQNEKGVAVTIDLDTIKQAEWDTEDYLRDGQDGTECITECDGPTPGTRTLVATCGSNPWQSKSTNVGDHTLTIEDNNDGGCLYIDYDLVVGGEDDEFEYTVSDIEEMLRDALGDDWPSWESVAYDYEAIATDYYNEHSADGYRYFIDDVRGFANEWTLHILTDSDDEADEAWRALDDRDLIIHHIADAAMSSRDYESQHGAMDATGVVVY